MFDKEKGFDEVEDDALSLVYIKVHRCVLEAFMAHNLSKTAIKVYLYLCFNSLVHQRARVCR